MNDNDERDIIDWRPGARVELGALAGQLREVEKLNEASCPACGGKVGVGAYSADACYHVCLSCMAAFKLLPVYEVVTRG